MTRKHVFAGAAAAAALLVVSALAIPDWAMFLVTMALAKGLVSLGIVGMMRGGLVSFGQGLYYCLGAYAAAALSNALGVNDIVVVTVIAVLASGAVGAMLGPLLATYRGIFFAMLSLALSMVLYGSLAKLSAVGGTDGLNVSAPTFLGWAPEGDALQTALYLYVGGAAIVIGGAMRLYFDSERGLITQAVRENELRVEYLGASTTATMAWNYVFGAMLGGFGGAVAALALGHVDPEFAFWTTSGEFVFVAILAGWLSVPAVFLASIILELVRSFSNLYFPNTWQIFLGAFLLAVIFLLPNGLGSLVKRKSGGGS